MSFALLGFSLGLGAGIAPGPLMAVVISHTLRGGWRYGLAISLAPLLSDALVIPFTLLLAGELPRWGLDVLTVLGGLFVAWLGVDTLRSARASQGTEAAAAVAAAATGARGQTAAPARRASLASRPLWQGVAVNLLNPHPYLFWLMVGTPILLRAAGDGWGAAVAFVAAFYLPLVGSKVILTFLVDRGARLGGSTAYRLLLGASGLGMLAAALVLLNQGLAGLRS